MLAFDVTLLHCALTETAMQPKRTIIAIIV
jgi:hypothetical protein